MHVRAAGRRQASGTDTVLVAVIDNTTEKTLLSCTVNSTNKSHCSNSSESGSVAAGDNIEVKLTATRRLQLSLNVQNLFNQSATISRFSTEQRQNGITFDEAAFYAGKIDFTSLIQRAIAGVAPGAPSFQDPRFLKVSDYQLPIIARIGAKLIF